jgi:hypothetical protein
LQDVAWLYTELGIDLPVLDTGSSSPSNPHETILARYVARLEEAEEESLDGEVLGVEGVDPTVEVMEWSEGLKSEVSHCSPAFISWRDANA